MNDLKLTSRAGPSHKAPMERICKGLAGASKILVVTLGCYALAGCITVNAPDKPIVIELNINIQQEVLYKIADDVQNTIKDNKDIF